MSIDFTGVTGIEDDYDNLTKITDASGRVLWSATIKFTINGDTYIADRGMTWAEWFASDYNTTGETADDVQSISANGTAVELSAVIVGGTAYEVGFGGFDVVIDLGNVTLKKIMPTMPTCFTNISLGELPSGYDTLTHAIVDGVMYELTLADTTAGYRYTLPNASVFQITINASASVIVTSYAEGTYNIQLGILS